MREDFNQGMLLSYRLKSTGEVVEQQVQTQTSPCHLGGQRYWFTCPGAASEWRCCTRWAATLRAGYVVG